MDQLLVTENTLDFRLRARVRFVGLKKESHYGDR
jgi:hypothetical protein